MEKKISREEAEQQVVLLAKRCALLYQSFAEVLVEELGEDKGREIAARAIEKYGTRCGSQVRKGVEGQGLDLTLPNYFTVPDLPSMGWVTEQKALKDEELEVDVLYCPLAEHWLAEGKASLGRLYCYVDQAKFSAYNPEYQCVHRKNVLDGDDRCTFHVSKKKK